MKRLVFDIEANNLLPKVNRIHCLAVMDADTQEEWVFNDEHSSENTIESGLELLDTADVIAGHNVINYDLVVLEKLMGWKPKAEVRDTLILSRLIYSNMFERDLVRRKTDPEFPPKMTGRHSLKAWGYRLGILKGLHIENHGFEKWTPELESYCLQDVKITAELWYRLTNDNYSEVSIELEHEFAKIMTLQEQRGIGFDVPAASELYAKLAVEKLELDKQLQEIFPPKEIQMKLTFWKAGDQLFETKSAAKASGFKDKEIERGPHKIKRIPFNSLSRDHIAERLQQKGWEPEQFTENGKPKVDETVLNSLPYPEAQMLSKILLLQKRMGQLGDGAEGWLKLECGGRLHGSVITNGAVTGRCTHRHPNMAQVPRDYEYRALFKPTDGMVLVGCDASGLEIRCLAHYMNDDDYTRKLLEEDIHTVNQEAAGLPTRDNAKTFIYGFLYGAGDAKIGQITGKGSGEGRKIKAKFLKAIPSLGVLKQKISRALQNRKWLVGLDKRRLFIRSEHAALNTLLQSAGAVVMKQATVILFNKLKESGLVPNKDFAFVAHVHDEFQVECWPEFAEKVSEQAVASIKEAGETFNFRCPLDGTAKLGNNWSETH